MDLFKKAVFIIFLSISTIPLKAQINSFSKQTLLLKSNFSMESNAGNNNLNSTLKTPFYQNKRALYSSLWAYASLNYLYADLMAFMDKDVHLLYETGVVEGLNMTPGFLTGAAVFMQIPIANVVLLHLIKNDKILKRVQIASGAFMTLIQGATLFMGKPTPYYATLSAFEMAATTFITVDAIKWKPLAKKKKEALNI